MGEGKRETALGLGERLRSARKARALSLEQVSQALHLEEQVLTALEEDRFQAVGAPVFVRGHLRNYARLLGLPEESVLQAYRHADPESERPLRMTRDREKPLNAGPGPLGVLVLVFIIALGLVLTWLVQDRPLEPAARDNPTPPPVANLPEPATAAEPVPVSPATSPPPAAPDTTGDQPAIGAAAPPTGPAGGPSAPGVRLTLEFDAPVWVEIADRSGRLLTGEQPAGSRQEVVGQPPFEVVLGDASAVRLARNGEPYPVPDSVRGSKVARFNIGAAE